MPILIALTKGQFALIDAADEAIVRQHTWRAHKRFADREAYYAYATIDGRKVYLHRFLMKPLPRQEVDHENRDGLDNRRVNLRIATHSQNGANSPTINGTGFRGVSRMVRSEKYRARIFNRSGSPRSISLGLFQTPEEAARAYDAAAHARFGEFAQLNFPQAEGR